MGSKRKVILGIVLIALLVMIFIIVFVTERQHEDYNLKLVSVLNENESTTVQDIFSFEFDRAYILPDCYISGEGFAKRCYLDISIEEVESGVSEDIQRIVFVDQFGDFVYEFKCNTAEIIFQEIGIVIYPDTKIERKSSIQEEPLIISFQGIGYYFPTAKLEFLHEIKLSETSASLWDAYYLSEDGTLYCAGADSDGYAYVLYQDNDNGIVAENVIWFSTMVNGGSYIDRDQNLYIWNRNDIPLYSYQKDEHTLLLRNIVSASVGHKRMTYIDSNHELYYVGEWDKETYYLDKPLKVGTGASAIISVEEAFIVWLDLEGKIQIFGSMSRNDLTYVDDLLYIKEHFQDFKIKDISSLREGGRLVLLENGELWFYGDYQHLTEDPKKKESDKELRLLCENVCSISSNSQDAFGALDSENRFFVWGRCWANNADMFEFIYVDKKLISDQATSIYLDGSTICYVDTNGASHIYHRRGYVDFYGNSTKDEYVGINREPVTWVEKKK